MSDPGQKFLGCLVSVRCKPKINGCVDTIIGTVQAIGREEHTITLNDGVLNGLSLPDNYVIMADEISSLELIQTLPDESYGGVHSDHENEPESEPEPDPPEIIEKTLSSMTISSSENQPKFKNFQEFTSAFKEFTSSAPVVAVVDNNYDFVKLGEKVSSGLPVVVTSSSSAISDLNGPDIVYSASTFEASYKAKEKRRSAFNAYSSPSNNLNQIPLTQKNTVLASTQNIVMNKLGVTNTTSHTATATTVTSFATQQNRNLKADKSSPAKPSYPFIKQAQNGQYSTGQVDRSPKNKLNQHQKNDEAFEMTIAEIKAEDYDFEENLAKFDKLPVGNIQKPVAIPKTPKLPFKSSDTTLQANRTIDSVKLRNMSTSKVFTTDTGIKIPALEVNVRNKILNMAHEHGLSHSLTVEIFGRSVAQVCLPLLGDSYRLSPERVNDRPTVLICTGPNWQGASGICAARILATQGVNTILYAPKEEATICRKEESLYKLTQQVLTRNIKDIRNRKYDLVILAMDDQQTSKFSFDPSQLPLQNTEIVLVDPPLVNSYSKSLTTTPARMGAGIGLSKIFIVSPLLPLAYRTNSKLKLFLVNLGIPSGIFKMNNVDYKSPFGDKLIIQFFSTRHEEE